MGKYIDRAKRISSPPDSLGHYDFIEGYGMAKGQMLTLLAEADQEIEGLTNQLENTRQILHNLSVAVSEAEEGKYIMAKATMSKEDYEQMLINEIKEIREIYNG